MNGPDDDSDIDEPTPLEDSDSDLDIIAPYVGPYATPSTPAFLDAMRQGEPDISLNLGLDINIIRSQKLAFAAECRRLGLRRHTIRQPLAELLTADALPVEIRMSGDELITTMDVRDTVMECNE